MESTDVVVYDGEEYPITLIYSNKRRTVGLTVKRDGAVLLRIPLGYPKEDAMVFARSKADWIAKHVLKFRAQETPVRQYADGDEIPFLGATYTIRRKEGSPARAIFNGTTLEITIPAEFNEKDSREIARTAVIYLFRRIGTERLKPDVEKYAHECGVITPVLRIREQETKWGCCTPKNGIILNVKILLAPQLVITYLIIHEISHLKFRNHQAVFWKEVERLMPNYKEAEALLKKDGRKWEF